MGNNNGVLKALGGYIDPESLILKKNYEQVVAKTDQNRVAFLPVRPDWNEPRKMWGYYNPLTGLFYPTDGLKVLLNAFWEFVMDLKNGKDRKHFIILDEMNLARVEYYMSDLLSLMENMWEKGDNNDIRKGETSQIHPYIAKCILSKPIGTKDEKIGAYVCPISESDCKKCPYYPLLSQTLKDWQPDANFKLEGDPIPPRIGYPENLTIIGTVNVDETTFSFSPKVLDRAFVVEFNDVNVDKYCKQYEIPDGKFKKFVTDLHSILKPATLHFGYRVISEMWDYLENAGEQGKPSTQLLDFLLKSKVLPKIHGTKEQVGNILKGLFDFCKSGEAENESNDAGEGETNPEKLELLEVKINDISEFRYPDSAKKIQDMYKRMEAIGYASFF